MLLRTGLRCTGTPSGSLAFSKCESVMDGGRTLSFRPFSARLNSVSSFLLGSGSPGEHGMNQLSPST